MAKYDEKLKLRVVRQYLSGRSGLNGLAKLVLGRKQRLLGLRHVEQVSGRSFFADFLQR